jgi:hypothetical protein
MNVEMSTQMWEDVSQGVGVFVCEGQSPSEALGYPIRSVELCEKVLDAMSDEELYALIQPEDRFCLVDAGSCFSRGVYISYGDGCYLLVEQSVQFCSDCLSTWPEFYMVRDDLWKAHGNDEGLLCMRCFEKRMGRKVVKADLNDAPLNSFPATLALLEA